MNNYKIKVNNEAESREAQDLFEQLGFMWASDYPENGDWYSHLYAEKSSCCHLPIYVWNGLGDKFQELTLPQLRDLAAKSKNEQGLISGADALRALADGKEVEANNIDFGYWIDARNLNVTDFFDDIHTFRLKPSTIKLSLEIPACGTYHKHGQLIWILNSLEPKEYCSVILDESDELPAYWWQSEEQVKQVVAALRGGIKG